MSGTTTSLGSPTIAGSAAASSDPSDSCSPVSAGGLPVSAEQTAPSTQCSLSAGYPSGPRMLAATSDGAGVVGWSWRVGPHVLTGVWPVTVVCGTATASTQITVS